MKPCSSQRQALTWLALEAVDPQAAAELQQHLRTCAACRAFYEQTRTLTAQLEAAALPVEPALPPGFHDTLRARLLATASFRSRWVDRLGAFFRNAELRWAWPATAVAVALVFLAALPVLRRPPPAGDRAAGLAQVARRARVAPPPTLANYYLAANRSLDSLDELLTRQALQPRASARIPRASSWAQAENWE